MSAPKRRRLPQGAFVDPAELQCPCTDATGLPYCICEDDPRSPDYRV